MVVYAGTGHPGFVGQILYTPFKSVVFGKKQNSFGSTGGRLAWHEFL